MKPDEWTDVCQWVGEHWAKGWPPEHQVSWYTDLEDFDASDVWAAVHHLYEEGRDFPPNGSVLLARCITERRLTAKADQYRGLPEPRGVPDPKNWIVRRFGEDLSGLEMVERIHKERPACGNKTCDLCYPVELARQDV